MDQQIIRTEYSEIMQKSYIDYAMSVIVARALPDIRDGLKPVQRRTLYDMYELGIRYDRPHRKCARIVGDTMGKYHPHGDSSIYESLVVMAQGFKKGMPLVDGHGNFGSIEGDGAAAMRYTEARLEKITQEAYLSDLDKDVVDFLPNFDATEKEPEVLPVKIPNLLVNGAEGIAVGMTTSIPPHNLGEVVNGVKALIDNDEITTKELMEIIPGPDFPTGGIVINKDELLDIYENGSGKVRLRGKVEIEKIRGGKEQLVITEIPYTMIGANIGKFLNDIFQLVETKKTNDITDISNQSSKEGIRIVLELRKGADIEKLLNLLYKKTRLEDTFGVNMLSVVKGRPEVMGIKKILQHNVDFQFEVNTRKYNNLLGKELEKKEIQEGLIKAYDVIDLIIEILRGSQNIKDAKACLVSGDIGNIKFKSEQSKKQAAQLQFSEKQATAILEMRLYRLIGLEIEALIAENEKTLKNIKRYESLLSNKKVMAKAIIKELEQISKEFATQRKTIVENGKEAVFEENPIEETDIVFLMDRFLYVRSIDVPTFERNKEAIQNESREIIFCKNTDRLAVFTKTGQLHIIKCLDLPFGKFRDKGIPIDNISNFNSQEDTILLLQSYQELLNGERNKVVFTTQKGYIKVVDSEEFNVTKKTVFATKLQEDDYLIQVIQIRGNETVVLQSKKGMFLRFEVSEIPLKKKGAIGVRGIKLSNDDIVEEAYRVNQNEEKIIEYKKQEIALHRLRI